MDSMLLVGPFPLGIFSESIADSSRAVLGHQTTSSQKNMV